MRALPFALAMFACQPQASDDKSLDADGDALVGDEDCDDEDDSVGGPRSYTVDDDNDGYGGTIVVACEEPDAATEADGDCDDNASSVHPGADEACDGIDNDCDGEVDEEEGDDFYLDADGDGFGDAAETVNACEPPAGYVSNAEDCDDNDSDVFPGGVELCNLVDDDCDGAVDDGAEGTVAWYADADRDGYGAADDVVESCLVEENRVLDDTDCDDADSGVFPGAEEVCNGIDDDCDGTVDEDDAVDAATWYYDADADGWGSDGLTTISCDEPLGYSESPGDCDDADPAYNPGESEPDCTDPNDYNCDGSVGYADADADGWAACEECDDNNAAASPAGTEVCDGADNDCDGTIDGADSTDASTWYADADTDGYGDAASATLACDAPSGSVADATDCDDAAAAVNPGATELCNGIDNDCDGTIDGADSTDASTWYADADTDGYGDAASATLACDAPSGSVADATDCDDAAAAVNPDATELCNSVDDDCDGTVDDGASAVSWYADDDGDGYGGAAETGCTAPADAADNAWDCDDTDGGIYPGSDVSCPWPSCLDLLDDGIASTTGDYWIDFDGVATETECDMDHDGGGWTLIFEDDMTSPDSGWSITSTYSCGSWGTILGGYGIMAGGEIDIDLDSYAIPHSEAWVEAEYIALDSWDGETAWVEVDATILWSLALNNHSSSYSEVCGWNRGYSGSYDSSWPVSEQVAHSAGSLNLVGGSTLDQGATDESFGLDDVWVWVR